MVLHLLEIAKTPRGSAQGFKIDVIEKCGDIKTQDNQTNLLCYIIQECEKKLQRNLISEECRDFVLFRNHEI